MKNEAQIKGALFDFMGFLTVQPGMLRVGVKEDAPHLIEKYEEWAADKGFTDVDADVMDWNK